MSRVSPVGTILFWLTLLIALVWMVSLPSLRARQLDEAIFEGRKSPTVTFLALVSVPQERAISEGRGYRLEKTPSPFYPVSIRAKQRFTLSVQQPGQFVLADEARGITVWVSLTDTPILKSPHRPANERQDRPCEAVLREKLGEKTQERELSGEIWSGNRNRTSHCDRDVRWFSRQVRWQREPPLWLECDAQASRPALLPELRAICRSGERLTSASLPAILPP